MSKMANAPNYEYMTPESRQDSFKKTTKKRASGAGGRGAKALNWPHATISSEDLADAGFYYKPTPGNVDNVACFLCGKELDGWEADDDPLDEHLKHSVKCGWAKYAAIKAGRPGHDMENPTTSEQVEARAQTFASLWPHEGREGWLPQTEKMVEAGWYYTPYAKSNDSVTCAHCPASLDGWEPTDDPWKEHYDRNEACPFFSLSGQADGKKRATAPAKSAKSKQPSKSKATRTSRVSRVSLSSLADTQSEVGSVDDLDVHDHTALTNTSTMTAGGKKPRAKKAAAPKTKKAKAKKEEATEGEDTLQPVEQASVPPSPPKPKRGKKRGSDAIEESTLSLATAPAPKKRTTRARASKTVESSVMETTDVDMSEVPALKKSTNGRKKASKTVESSVLEPSQVESFEPDVSVAVPAKKATGRSKKTTKAVESSVIEPSEVVESELEPDRPVISKKKGASSRKKNTKSTVDSSVMEDTDTEIAEAPAPKRKPAVGKNAKSARKTSTASQASNMSTISMQSALEEFPADDEEIDRQLELDLERPLTDDEDIMGDSDSERYKAKKRVSSNGRVPEPSDYAMFDPHPVETNDMDVDDELKRLEQEMQVDQPIQEPEPEQLQVPKKGRKAAPRKVSKQTKTKKTKASVPRSPPQEFQEPEPEPVSAAPVETVEMDEQHEHSVGSTDTVVHNVDAIPMEDDERPSRKVSFESVALDNEQEQMEDIELVKEPTMPEPAPPKKRGRPSKASVEARRSLSVVVSDEPKPPVESVPQAKKRGRPTKASVEAKERQGSVLEEPGQVAAPQPKKRGRPPKKSLESVESLKSMDELDNVQKVEAVPEVEIENAPAPKRKPGRPSKATLAAQSTLTNAGAPKLTAMDQQAPSRKADRAFKKAAEASIHREDVPPKISAARLTKQAPKARALADIRDELASPSVHASSVPASPFEDAQEIVEYNAEEEHEEEGQHIYEEPSSPLVSHQHTPATPRHAVSHTQSATQATISPSPSPQASDAENQPPSSRPGSGVKTETKRIALAPIDATPKQLSPSKRNIIAGLQSSVPWTAVDLDAVIGTPRPGVYKENGVQRLIKKGKELTSPEKDMTVEEWVYHNASQAEKMLKEECEAMVSRFESEGTRAMNVLETLVVE